MPVKIHGKDYKTVAERVAEFHDIYKDKTKSIITEIIQFKDGIVVVKAAIKIGENVFNPYLCNVSIGRWGPITKKGFPQKSGHIVFSDNLPDCINPSQCTGFVYTSDSITTEICASLKYSLVSKNL